MADKIPYEVLLPVALELFQKVPFPEISIEEDNLIKVAQRDKLTSQFANFYHSLHQKLVDPTRAASPEIHLD